MELQKKLEVIQKALILTQTQAALRFGVSFVAYNSWWNGKSVPRPKALAKIDELYLEVTGQRVIPRERLLGKKRVLRLRSAALPNIIEILQEHNDIRDELILKLTYNSNSIEGSTLTEADTAAVLFENANLADKSLIEHLEAKNHQAALLRLFAHLAEGGKITEELVLQLHGMLMNGIRTDAGSYRRHAVRLVGVHLPTANYLKIPSLIPPLLTEAARKTGNVIAVVAKSHASFEQIHPFSDGNGRIGRMLMTAMLLRANVAPAIIRQTKKRLYFTYLYKAQSVGDHSQLEDFLCDAVDEGFSVVERG